MPKMNEEKPDRTRRVKGAGPKKDRKIEEAPVDVAFRKLKEMMYHHEIVPGQKLLYQELAGKLDMSITPIIQALNRLQLLNLVYSERNKGYYVGEADPVEARELFVAREALETFLVPSVIEKLTDQKIRAIEDAMEEHGRAASAPERRRLLMIRDTNFHLKIIECAENRVIYDLGKWILEQIYLKYRPEYMRDERLREAAEEHRMLLISLKERDVKKTTGLLRRHIRKGMEHIVGGLWNGNNIEI